MKDLKTVGTPHQKKTMSKLSDKPSDNDVILQRNVIIFAKTIHVTTLVFFTIPFVQTDMLY